MLVIGLKVHKPKQNSHFCSYHCQPSTLVHIKIKILSIICVMPSTKARCLVQSIAFFPCITWSHNVRPGSTLSSSAVYLLALWRPKKRFRICKPSGFAFSSHSTSDISLSPPSSEIWMSPFMISLAHSMVSDKDVKAGYLEVMLVVSIQVFSNQATVMAQMYSKMVVVHKTVGSQLIVGSLAVTSQHSAASTGARV